MINHLHKKLTFIYSFTISVTLTLVMIFTFFTIRYQLEQNSKKEFLDILEEIEYKLETEQNISLTWLSTISVDNKAFVYIEDNGIPIFIMDKVQSPIDNVQKVILKASVVKLAKKDGIDISTYPISFSKKSTKVFYLTGSRNTPYYGCASSLASQSGWHSIVLIQSITKQQTLIRNYALVFIFIDLLVIIFLFYFSRYFVGKTLQPVIESQQKQKEFIAAASHELRSPLAVVRATLTSLMLTENDSQPNLYKITKDDRLRYYKDIDEESIRMSKLIDDLLILSSTQAKTWTLRKEPFDAEALLSEIYEKFSLIANEKGLNLLIELPDNVLTTITADKYRIRQVLSVLLDNAISYTPAGKNIIISACQKRHSFLIKIIDQGIGIPDDKKAFVYDKFYRADTSRIDKNHFGLGLTIAKELVLLHDGKISLQDTPGGGTTFILEIPIG